MTSSGASGPYNAGRRLAGMLADEAAVYEFCIELTERHGVTDPTFANLKKVFTDRQIVDQTAVSGIYVTSAMLLAVGRKLPLDGPTQLPALAADEHARDATVAR